MPANSYLIPKIEAPFNTEVTLPGSKSIALRQLAISALCTGTTELHGIPVCDDTAAMLDCLSTLGCSVLQQGTEVRLTGPMDLTTDVELNARMSGASTRLLLGLAALRTGTTRIDGHESLRVRTNAPLLEVLAQYGCVVESPRGGLPATIRGPMQPAATLEIDGSISSQYITALAIVAPHLPTLQEIQITGNLVSRPYLDITRNEMAKRGVQLDWAGPQTLSIGPQRYTTGTIQVEGDATAASYFSALATLHGSTITLTNLRDDSAQGDYGFCHLMEKLGADVRCDATGTRIRGPQQIRTLPPQDLTAMPDAALTLIAMAPMIPGDTEISGLSTLHHKECDRLECSARELAAMGVNVETTADSIRVAAAPLAALQAHQLSTYHDHRMAMAFSTVGSVTGELTVDDKQVVDKTYPTYWDAYEGLLR